VAAGLLGAFVSRNNDVGGFWALGKLSRHAQTSQANEITVDLFRSNITPPSDEFDDMIGRFRLELVNQIAARKLSHQWLSSAEIRVRFGDVKRAGQPAEFDCLVALVDDLGHVHQARGKGTCWPHDPARESKSTRS
jgi:hypothetical protein